MTLLMMLVLAPFGGITALCLREYAKQGKLVSIVRVSVNPMEEAVHSMASAHILSPAHQ